MTARTFQFYGQGWGPQTAEITVTLAGQTLYSGFIPTVPDQPVPLVDPVLLFSASALDVSDQGTFNVTVTPTVGNVAMGTILTNYVAIANPIYTPEQWTIVTDPAQEQQGYDIINSLASPPFSPSELGVLQDPASTVEEKNAILAAHGVAYTVSTGADEFSDCFWQGDCRSNLTIDGVPVSAPIPRPDELTGDWVWSINTGQLCTFTFNMNAGLE